MEKHKPKTVRELIAFLEKCDPDSYVAIQAWHKLDRHVFSDLFSVKEVPCLVKQSETGISGINFYEWIPEVAPPGKEPPKTKMVMIY